MFECLLWRYRSARPATGAGALGAVDLGMAYALLEEVTINHTTELPERIQYWANRLLEGTNKICVYQNSKERSSDPQETDRHSLAHKHPRVSSRGMGQRWPAAGLGH